MAQSTNEEKPVLNEQTAVKPQTRSEKLDALFADLKRERDPKEATKISNRIWIAWANWDDDAINLLMRRAQTSMQSKNFSAALDILDQVVVLAPDYSEAWNRRATVYYMANDYGRSIADVEQTLALEPRHYGAWMGLAQMMQALGEKKKAIFALQQALNVYPAMERPQETLVKLLEEVEGESL